MTLAIACLALIVAVSSAGWLIWRVRRLTAELAAQLVQTAHAGLQAEAQLFEATMARAQAECERMAATNTVTARMALQLDEILRRQNNPSELD